MLDNHECDLPGLEEHYTPPDGPWPGSWVKVIDLPILDQDDGARVIVEEMRLPARCYRISFLGVTLSTGCGWDVGKLVADITRGVSGGLLAVDSKGKTT